MNNEKKKLHASTILISLSIVILIGVAVFLGYSYYKEKQHATNLQEEVKTYMNKANTLEGDVLTVKQELEAVKNQDGKKPQSEVVKNLCFDPDKGKKPYGETFYFLKDKSAFEMHVGIDDNGKVLLTNFLDNNEYVTYGIVENIKQIVIEKQKPFEITGFTKKVADVEISAYGQQLSETFAIFLMEDGTCEYIGLKDMLTNPKTRGAIPNLNNIVRIENAHMGHNTGGGINTMIGIDKDGNFHDLGYLITQTGYNLK